MTDRLDPELFRRCLLLFFDSLRRDFVDFFVWVAESGVFWWTSLELLTLRSMMSSSLPQAMLDGSITERLMVEISDLLWCRWRQQARTFCEETERSDDLSVHDIAFLGLINRIKRNSVQVNLASNPVWLPALIFFRVVFLENGLQKFVSELFSLTMS